MIKLACRKTFLSLLCMMLCMAYMQTHAQKESFSQKLQGWLKPGDSCVVIDDKYALLSDNEWGSIKHVKVEDLITFQLRFDTMGHIPHRPFKAELLVDIYYWKSDRSQEKPEEKKNISLRIEYDTLKGKAIKTKDYFTLKGAHKMAVVIRKIKSDYFKDSLPPFFQLKNELFLKRQYPFDPAQPVKMVITSKASEKGLSTLALGRTASNEQNRLLIPEAEADCGQAADLIHIAIPPNLDDTYSVPAEYDIEYCFVDYDSEEGNAIRTIGVSSLSDAFCAGLFRFNGTRVTIPEAISSSGYDVYLVYPKGYMFYRIRGVGYSGDIRNERNAWNYREDPTNAFSAICMRAIGDGSTGSSNPHEACLNWQYNASFAEDAKHKDVVTYFDGKLQTRQTVTLSKTHIANAEDLLTAVVQESILDEFGRPTVNILPAPTDATEIKYYRNFNTSAASGIPYNYTDFVDDGEDCSEFAQPLRTSDWGAGQYYSGNNPFKATWASHQYVPDAGGYPFTVTQYTPDQTGRIRNQGGVGPKFQVKKDDVSNTYKYSKYFYGKPSQFQLDRLFGSEAGNSSHYQKNMVVDPNGQISVSYVNSTGKTVATALAGLVTPNLDQLPSYYEPAMSPATKLIKPSDFSFDASTGEIQATATFLAPVAGTYNLQNTLEKLQYSVFHGPSLSSQLCYTCYYDIVVDVRNSCNLSLLPTGPYTVAAGTSFDPNTSCTPASLPPNNWAVTIGASNIGECFVTYTLKLSSKATDAYTQDHWQYNTNLKRFKYFFEKLMSEASMKDCYSECAPCKELEAIGKTKFVADLKTYIQKVIAVKNDPNIIYSTSEADAYFGRLYDSLKENCDVNVLPACLPPGPCETKLVMIKNDVSPGGQYALYNADALTPTPISDPASIFAGSPAKYTQAPTDWGGAHIYPNPDNPAISDTVIKDDGTAMQPENLSPEEFIRYFKPHWANTLALWHPEYCYYKWCILNEPSRIFDEHIKNIDAHEAVNTSSTFSFTNYFVPNSSSSGLGDPASILVNDPFFQPCGAGYPYVAAMNWELKHFKKISDGSIPLGPNTYIDLLEFIDHTIYCSGGSWVAGTCTPADECRKREREWDLFVNYYLQLKQRYDEMARRCWKSTCVNCYIGTDGINREDMIEDPKCVGLDGDWTALLPTACGIRFNEGCYPANPSNEDPYATVEPCLESLCEKHPDRSSYENKTRLYPEYVDPCTVANFACSKSDSFTSNVNDSINKAFTENCTAAVENLLEELKKRGCTSHLTVDQIAALKAALIANCQDGLAELNPVGPNGVIEILHSDAVSSSSSTDFEHILAGTPYLIDASNGCSVDLVGIPYPKNKQTYNLVQITVDQASTSVCDRLDYFRHRYEDAHGSATPSTTELYAYLQAMLQQDFILTWEEFEDLVATCGSRCNPKLLNKDILLPSALSKDAACRSCEEINAALVLFNAKYTHLSPSDPQYELLFKNFMNHHFGFALSYTDYYNFMLQCDAEGSPESMILCDKSAAPQFLQEEYSCLKDKIDNAFTGAIYLFYQYKDSVDQAFKNAYTFNCRYAKPTLTLSEPFQEYHYTLYYYDQAGNLVKTVPPQGVRTLDNTTTNEVPHPWEAATSNHYLQVNGTKNFTLESLSLSDKPVSVEMWVNKASGSGAQVVFDATLNKQRAHNTSTLANDYEKMKLELNSSGNFVFTHVYFKGVSAAATKNTDTYTFTSSSLATGSWKQVALVYNPSSSCLIYVDGVPFLVGSPASSSSVLTADWDLDPLTGNVGMVFNAGGVSSTPAMAFKEVRIYGRGLSANEIGFNRTLIDHPYSYTDMDAYYKLNEGSGTSLNNYTANVFASIKNTADWIDNTSTFTATSHFFVTSYAYNSLNQVVKQHTPDGGTSRFWYDRLGRLVISQNEEQLTSSTDDPSNRFSYTKYDPLGRIIEVGEKTGLPELNDAEVRDNCILNKWMFNLPSSGSSPACATTNFSAGIDKQITVTRYSNISNTGAADGRTITVPSSTVVSQENLRNRVAATFYIEQQGQPQKFATYYNYDISGNVKTLWQQLVPMAAYDLSGIKRMDYNYDLVSGKVNDVWYQQGKVDQFYYQYKYDAENRLTEAWSGKGDGTSECKQDAAYFYYLHGPLARTELGEAENKLQGIDYSYTLQGWLKGVNGTLLNAEKDMGQDGYSGSASRANFGRDVYNFGLNYYSSDYTAITGGSQPFSPYTFSTKSDAYPVGRELFNGNIASISLSLSKINNGMTTGYSYGYDQLNRLVNMHTHNPELLAAGEAWGRDDVEEEKYAENYQYDANGNILKLKRNGPGTATSPTTMDDLKYRYYYVTTSDEQREYYFNLGDKEYYDYATNLVINMANVKYFTNKLAHVNDNTAYTTLYTTDIDNQSAGHYAYDHIGNMIGDAENSKSIKWTVYGKIKSVQKIENDATVKKINYQYDVSGNRVIKQVNNKVTFYIRDAQGNTMAVYDGIDPNYVFDPGDIPAYTDPSGYSWQEQDLYGSSRLGMFTPRLEIPRGTIDDIPYPAVSELAGQRTYELSNHLGNVHVTIANILREASGEDGIPFFTPEILSTTDYYPFGMAMPERSGYKVDGGWASGTDNLNGNSVPQQMTVDSRTGNTPAEYKASSFIEFVAGFVSGTGDEFVAYIANGFNMPGGSSGGTGSENVYRYGFNGQEKSDDVTAGNYTAEYWEYDSRIGRRWNLDVVEKAWISGYATLGNNPVMMVDPDGADWKKGKGGTYTWTDGKGKAGGFWTERNKAGISTWYGTTKDDIQMDGGMSYVTVTSHKKHGLRFLPSSFNHTAAEAAQWKIDRSNFDKGNYSALLPSQISMYKRWDQADKEWRQMSLGAVGIIAAPLVVMGAVETGAASAAWQGSRWLFQQGVSESGLMKEGAKWLGRKYGRSFMTEVGINFFQNGMDIKKMDAFDILTNTLNPYRQCLKGRVLMGGVNSLVDINLFAGQGQRLSYLGNGKNFGQAGMDFSFSLFNEGMKYTFGTLGGGNANRDFVLDVITGNAGGQAQQAAGDKK